MWDDRGNRVVLIGIAVVVVLLLVAVVLVAALGSTTSTGSKANTNTTTPVPTYASPDPTKPATTKAPTTTKAPAHVPQPADFGLEVIETKRSCFGSAGCNITFKINPTYIGEPTDPTIKYTIVYEVSGGDDVKMDNFTMQGTGAKVSTEEHISTPPNPTITAQVTRVVAG